LVLSRGEAHLASSIRASAIPASAPTKIAGLVSIIALILVGAVLVGGVAWDNIRREQVRPQVMAMWKPARRAVADRLKQPEPLEFGAVWATHDRMICGVVNGWGSFGGLTGMTPFVVAGSHAVFLLDVGAQDFAPYWRQCIADKWITILEDSMETGFCATRRGQSRCVTVTG
jgi:hypothetical protein